MKETGGTVRINFVEALQLIFITLRLCNVIKWNWIWVLCPTWGAILFAALFAWIKAKRIEKKMREAE